MNSQELRNLSEAYMNVYSSTEEIDEATATPPSKFNVRKGLDAKSRRLRRSSDFYAYGKDPDPEERKISTSKGEGGITKNPKKLRKQKAMGEFREQVDLYDIILSHLLDEGYAETQEQAEVSMVTMSEDGRESICEEYKKLPVGKMMWKAVNRTEREADARADREREANEPNSTITYDRAREEHEKAEKNKERNYKMVRVADTHSKKEAKAKSKLKNKR